MKPLTVGVLRAALQDVPDDTPVLLEMFYDGGELLQSSLHRATVEERCDEKDCLYLCGDSDEADDDRQVPYDFWNRRIKALGG